MRLRSSTSCSHLPTCASCYFPPFPAIPNHLLLSLTRVQNLRALQLIACVDATSIPALRKLTQLDFLSIRFLRTFFAFIDPEQSSGIDFSQIERQVEALMNKRAEIPNEFQLSANNAFHSHKFCHQPIPM